MQDPEKKQQLLLLIWKDIRPTLSNKRWIFTLRYSLFCISLGNKRWTGR